MTQLQTNAAITLSLTVGQVLTVAVSTLGAASVVRLRAPGAGDPYPPTALSDGGSSVFGPFSELAVFRVLCVAGSAQYSIGFQENTGSVLGLVADDLSAATVNTAALQAALTTGGSVSLTTHGAHYFNRVMAIPSNTSVYVGAEFTTKVADGAPSALFTNSTARSTGVAVSAANATYATAPDGFNYCAVISNLSAANAALFPVGSWVSVVVLGHGALGVQGTAWTGRGYRGVRQVVEQTINGASSSIKYLIDNVYPGSAPSSNNLTLYQVNENIRVWGPGTIDGNGALADQSYNTGDPRGCLMWWRHYRNLTVEGLNFKPRFALSSTQRCTALLNGIRRVRQLAQVLLRELIAAWRGHEFPWDGFVVGIHIL